MRGMTPRQTTQVVLLLAFLVLGAYDLFAYLAWGREQTLSVVLFESSVEWPVIPFALGFLAGHLFWPIRD